ncbi:hypothetical protein ACLOJK_031161 [Asimina triloba]
MGKLLFPVIFCNAAKACRPFSVGEKNQQSSYTAAAADGGNPSALHNLPLSQIGHTNLTIPFVDQQNGHQSSIPHVYGCCRSEPAMQLAKNEITIVHGSCPTGIAAIADLQQQTPVLPSLVGKTHFFHHQGKPIAAAIGVPIKLRNTATSTTAESRPWISNSIAAWQALSRRHQDLRRGWDGD